MISEGAHLNQSPGVYHEMRVGETENQKKIAIAATKQIEGAQKIIEDYFHQGKWKMPFALKPNKVVNLPHHLGW